MKEFAIKGTGLYIRYHDFPGSGTPILFIHGLGCAGSFDYPEVASQKELSEHRRILVDLLGSGFSDKPNDFSYSVNAHAEYLLNFTSSLNLNSFILFGHSLGGAIALSLASKCGESIERIILSEPNLDAGGGSTSKAIASYTFKDFIDHGFSEIIAQNQNESNQMWASSFSVSSPTAVHRISQSAIDGGSPSWRDILYSLNCPKTYIYGEKSLPDDDMHVLKSRGIRIEIVENAGHSMAWENAKGLAAAIKNGIEYN